MNRRWLAAAGGLLLGVASWWIVPRLLRELEVFRVRRIEIEGVRYLSPETVTLALGLRPDASIFDPLGPASARVRLVPGVERAVVRRRVPGTLTVTIEEREPVALAAVKDRLVPVDRSGTPLPFDPARAAPDLPIAVGDTTVLGVIRRLAESAPGLVGQVVTARRERQAVLLETGEHRLWLRPGASPRDLQNLVTVMHEVERRGMNVTDFDARFDGRIIVRRAGRR